MEKQISPCWVIDKPAFKYLQDEYSFTSQEIKQWFNLFKSAQGELNFLAEKNDMQKKLKIISIGKNISLKELINRAIDKEYF